MRFGLAPARLLVKRLVVPEPHALTTEEPGSKAGDLGMEVERPDAWRVFPQHQALQEGLAVRRFLMEAARVRVCAVRHRGVYHGLEALDLCDIEQATHGDEAV